MIDLPRHYWPLDDGEGLLLPAGGRTYDIDFDDVSVSPTSP
jgi:hypothetical protein